MYSISVETPLQDDVRTMVAALNAYLRPLSPPEFQFQMTVDQMANSATTLFVVRDNSGKAIGMGAVKVESHELGEVKRMYVAPSLRSQGLGHMILSAVEEKAREKNLTWLKLETGATGGFEAAWRVYERAGFMPCGAYLDYPDSGYSRFYEKKLKA
jgi:putative acetyltransferase